MPNDFQVYSEGNVSWKNDNGQVFQAQEIYVDSSKAIVDTTHDLERLKLPQGRHEFPLDYILPDNVPSSYIGKYGNVTYTMKVMGEVVEGNEHCSRRQWRWCF